MPGPISSRVDDPYRPYSSNDDEEPLCNDSSCTSTDASTSTARSDESTPAAPTHAEHGVASFGANAHAGPDDNYVGAFALKGHDVRGADIEVFSLSAHAGRHDETVQVGMARVGLATDDQHWSARVEAFTAQAGRGHDNADGSVGYHAGFGYTVVGAEATGTIGPLSLTGGASVGTTFGISVGVRDSDHDGIPEICERIDFGVGTVGFCLEDRANHE